MSHPESSGAAAAPGSAGDGCRVRSPARWHHRHKPGICRWCASAPFHRNVGASAAMFTRPGSPRWKKSHGSTPNAGVWSWRPGSADARAHGTGAPGSRASVPASAPNGRGVGNHRQARYTTALSAFIRTLPTSVASRRRRKEQALYLRSIVDHLPQGISVFDDQPRLKCWNDILLQVLDRPMPCMRMCHLTIC